MQERFKVKYENIKDWDSLKKLTWENIEPCTDVMYIDHSNRVIIYGKVVFKHLTKNNCVIDFEDGYTYSYSTTSSFESCSVYIKPWFILEGKAVYKGDVLWNLSEGCTDLMYITSYIDGDLLYTEPNQTVAYCEKICNLT